MRFVASGLMVLAVAALGGCCPLDCLYCCLPGNTSNQLPVAAAGLHPVSSADRARLVEVPLEAVNAPLAKAAGQRF